MNWFSVDLLLGVECLTFSIQSLGSVVACWVFASHFDRLFSYTGSIVRAKLLKILTHEFRRVFLGKTEGHITNEQIHHVRLASKAANQALAALICSYVVGLRCVWLSKKGWGEDNDFKYFFLLLHIGIGIWAISTSINTWVHFYGVGRGKPD